MNGVAIFQDFTLLKSNPTIQQPIIELNDGSDCCYDLIALAEIGEPSNDLYNDKHRLYLTFDYSFTGAVMYIEKYINNAWVETEIEDDTLGELSAYNFYTTIYNESAMSFLVDWNKVLNDSGFGEGKYRIKCTATLLDSSTQDYYSFEFCLKKYSNYLADKTVRLDWYKNGNHGSLLDDTKRIDYGTLNLFNSIRLPNSFFGNPNPEFEESFNLYQTGAEVWKSRSTNIEYTLMIDQAPMYLINYLAYDANYNSMMYVTDYNTVNKETYLNKMIRPSSSFKPTYDPDTKLFNCEFSYRPFYNNHQQKRQ